MPNTLDNHALSPISGRADCLVYHNPGWRAARSFHPGGVNLLYRDGHAAFVHDAITPPLWRALATRAGGESVGPDPLGP